MQKKSLAIFLTCILLSLQTIQANPVSAEPKLQAILPCAVSTQLPCLDSITATDRNGKTVNAVMMPNYRKYPASFAGLTTEPVNHYEWRVPGSIHENRNDRLSVNLMYFPYGAKYCWLKNECSVGVDEIIINISGAWWDNQPPPTEFPHKPTNKMCGTIEDPTVCIRGWGADGNFEYSFNVKIDNNFSFSHANGEARNGFIREWFNTKNEKIITVSATPVDRSFVYTTDLNPSTFMTQQKADATYAQLSAYIQSSRSDQSKWLEKCDYGKGMSLWYSGNLESFPTWFPEDGSVGVSISSPHLRADGSINVGAFNIAMPLETAKCLWGVDLSKSISALVSASYESTGTPVVVTTTTSVSHGYFNVMAAGFHFSSPAFRVKLSQTAERSPITTVSPSPKSVAIPSAAVVKRLTITCIKGKTTKKVTSANPKCPAGYKKK